MNLVKTMVFFSQKTKNHWKRCRSSLSRIAISQLTFLTNNGRFRLDASFLL